MAQEKNFENRVKSFLESIGCYNFGTPNQNMTVPITGYYEKRWGGGQFSKSGLPDMHVVLHNQSIEIELKAPNGKPSLLQLKNLALINASGSHGYILVEHKETVIKLGNWINDNFPSYANAPIIDFEKFKNIAKSFL